MAVECERYVKAPLHHYPLAQQQQRHPNIYITDNTWPRVSQTTVGPRDTGLTDRLVKAGQQYH